MRFANVPPRISHERAPAAEFLRRLIGAPAPGATTRQPQVQQRADEPPRDLDQRVRLVGEW